MAETIGAVEVVQLLFLLEVDVVVIMVVVVASEHGGRGSGTGTDDAATSEFRSQYIVYAELQRPLG